MTGAAMNLPVAAVVLAYAVVAMLLVSLNLTSTWRWWVKATAIITTTVFFGLSYQAINGLMGWPTAHRLPHRFNLIAARVAEPDPRHNDPGHIYLWADVLDDNNVPSGRPRSYQLAYSKAMARRIGGAQEKLDRGIEVMGVLSENDTQEDAAHRNEIKPGRTQKNDDHQSPATDTVPFAEDGSDISFDDLPPVVMPDKGPLP